MDYRVEDKYLITDIQINYLKMRLKDYMQLDSHSTDGAYLVRSMYFDDRYNSCLLANENSVDQRYKYRIRTYDNDLSTLRLEKKSVRKGYVHKDSCLLDISKISKITAPQSEDAFLYKCLYKDINLRGFHPVSIVEYERTAFVEKIGNVRITFDRNIGGCYETDRFTESVMPVIPLLPRGTHILEVKYDEILPGYIKRLINTGNLTKTSYSKYYYSRNAIVMW